MNIVNKELQKNNKALLIACEKMDKKQEILEKITYKRDELKKQLDIILSTSELTKRENPKQYSTTREEFLIEERDKILFHKGFIFNLYQTDKDRVNAYQNEREKYEEDINKKNQENELIISSFS